MYLANTRRSVLPHIGSEVCKVFLEIWRTALEVLGYKVAVEVASATVTEEDRQMPDCLHWDVLNLQLLPPITYRERFHNDVIAPFNRHAYW